MSRTTATHSFSWGTRVSHRFDSIREMWLAVAGHNCPCQKDRSKRKLLVVCNYIEGALHYGFWCSSVDDEKNAVCDTGWTVSFASLRDSDDFLVKLLTTDLGPSTQCQIADILRNGYVPSLIEVVTMKDRK